MRTAVDAGHLKQVIFFCFKDKFIKESFLV
jgi:hypothetical protein